MGGKPFSFYGSQLTRFTGSRLNQLRICVYHQSVETDDYTIQILCCTCVQGHLWRQEIENFHTHTVSQLRKSERRRGGGGMCGMSAIPTKANPRANNIYANLIICTRTHKACLCAWGLENPKNICIGRGGVAGWGITDAPNWLQWHPREQCAVVLLPDLADQRPCGYGRNPFHIISALSSHSFFTLERF